MERFGAMQLFHRYYSGEISIVQLMKEGSRGNVLWIFGSYAHEFKKKLGVKVFSHIYLELCWGKYMLEGIENYLRIGLNRKMLMEFLERDFRTSYLGLDLIDVCELLRRFKVPVKKIKHLISVIPEESRFFHYMVTEQAEKWRAIGIDPKRYVAKDTGPIAHHPDIDTLFLSDMPGY